MGPPVAVKVITSPSQKYSSGALDVNEMVGGSLTVTVKISLLASVTQPFESVICMVTTSPLAIAFKPIVEEVNVLLP